MTEPEFLRSLRDKWPKGPWDDEPSFESWVDESTGYTCAIERHAEYGHLCGYVRIDPAHPLHGVHRKDEVPDELVQDIQGLMTQPVGKRNIVDVFTYALHVHSGAAHRVGMLIDVHDSISFSDHIGPGHEPMPVGFWWGFACMGHRDFMPGMHALRMYLREVNPELRGYPYPDQGDVYRDWAYTKSEVQSLARQLAAIANVFDLMNSEARAHAIQIILKAKEKHT